MSARITRNLLVTAIASTALFLLPAAANAGSSDLGLSAVDSIAADVALDGKNDSKPATETSAGDSPTKDTYGTSTDSVPPPVTCDGSTSDSSSKPATETSTKPATDTCAIEECSSADTDGKDASGKPCTETTTETPVVEESPCVDGGGAGDGFGDADGGGATVCGGGGDEPIEQPTVDEPVAGGGDPLPEPAEVAGGGGPELPFTGLPLWYAIYGGIALMLAGLVLWTRGRLAGKGA